MLKLKNYIKLNPKEHISKGEIVRQVAMADLEPFNRDIKKWSYIKYKSGTKFRNGDILLARITPCLENGKTSFVNSLKQGEVAVGSTEFYVLRAIEGKMDPNYLYYLSISQNFRKNLIKSMTGTSGRQRVTKEALLNYETDIPDIDNQKDIGLKLSLIDDIISINNKINDNLDELMTLIFEKFINKNKFKKESLSNIANYQNGLAMKNFPPKNGEKGLPVLKIKELNQGYTDFSSDRCTSKIDNSVTVHVGDIVFSWSGTLLVKNWSGNIAGLNQHLFKVTSKIFPEWFIYEWTKYYLRKFQIIAAGKATTMGHIKRSDINNSIVYVPNKSYLNDASRVMNPIYNKRIEIIKENQQLNTIKQVLLHNFF